MLHGRRLDALAVFAAVAGIVLSVADGFDVRKFSFMASDFKTLFASAYCFARGLDAYSVTSLAHVFQTQGVVQPESWFGHSAVYPPCTLLLLAPLTYLSMTQAAWVWMLLNAACFGAALYQLSVVSFEQFGLSRPWRLAVIAVAVALPLLSFALVVGNVSVLVSSLCLSVIAARERGRWWQSLALVMAVLLKPHIAVWLVVALLLGRNRADRRTAWRALLLGGAVGAAILLWAVFDGHLAAQFASYGATLHAELGAGSMNPASVKVELPASEIVSLVTLLSYWLGAGVAASAWSLGLLLLLAGGLLVASRREDTSWTGRLLRINGWLALGLIATYHRAHDALVLYAMLPWIAARLRSSLRSVDAWLLLALFGLLSFGGADGSATSVAAQAAGDAVTRFLLYRQSASVALALAGVLTVLALRARRPLETGRAM